MNLKTIQTASKGIGNYLLKNSPTILTGFGVAGLISTVALAIHATPKAAKIIDEADYQRQTDRLTEGYVYEPLTNMEIAKLIWRLYVPTGVMGLMTIACMIGANSISLRRQAALASLYSIADATLKEYQAKVIETIGENKENKIHEAILQDKLNKNPIADNTVIVTGKGQSLFYDSLSGRYFKSDLETIRKIQNDFNETLINEADLTLNELYDQLDLERTELGNDLGWSTDYGLLRFKFSAKIATDGQPCIVLDYEIGPKNM